MINILEVNLLHILKELLNKAPELINQQDQPEHGDGVTPLGIAIARNSWDCFQVLLSNENINLNAPSVFKIDEGYNEELSPLMQTCRFGLCDWTFEILRNERVDPLWSNSKGMTALHCGAISSDVISVQYICEFLATKNDPLSPSFQNRDLRDITPMVASLFESQEGFQISITEPKASDSSGQWVQWTPVGGTSMRIEKKKLKTLQFYPLEIAVISGRLDICSLLIASNHPPISPILCSELNPKFQNAFLNLYCRRGNQNDVEKLLKQGADPDCEFLKKRTCLHQAVIGGHVGVVRMLLQAAADPNKVDLDGRTPLKLAQDMTNSEGGTFDRRAIINLLTTNQQINTNYTEKRNATIEVSALSAPPSYDDHMTQGRTAAIGIGVNAGVESRLDRAKGPSFDSFQQSRPEENPMGFMLQQIFQQLLKFDSDKISEDLSRRFDISGNLSKLEKGQAAIAREVNNMHKHMIN